MMFVPLLSKIHVKTSVKWFVKVFDIRLCTEKIVTVSGKILLIFLILSLSIHSENKITHASNK